MKGGGEARQRLIERICSVVNANVPPQLLWPCTDAKEPQNIAHWNLMHAQWTANHSQGCEISLRPQGGPLTFPR